ncbi:enoyl-CoA delta isomerase 2-like isoform X1 [Xenia sp. Carnegie-2017]|nr:enoyl-CoA delta isomerase 2-like isoform X6 [Xenia sp. Carnegie-2017]XP_046842138.1 enoyl-CoA delta isomerase 2-like isoform X7 [Xenia sp. Carnegie-2017]XP_046842142.1 enoyl-CoA delta isomerase 2-like isoform X3 [Xenia sp. Carnegie-2017]XP_046843621.1 enoyl-CoA delta isomerase 2-like [Xenia sp. Carnegie-2017]XP_046850691.1 enoyl-CoA delta isomerase 2-like isoform X1 [Xenia sp. Carnegie-2017]XP_046850692.1 enoyl-CoA delta isomerase 2-like isoform X1 [Xenia sp. Carnegie-2017]XP_046850694.1 e
MAEEKQRRQVEDSLMKLNVVEAPSIRSRVLDEDSSTTENMNESKHVYDDKGSCELTYSSCFLKATFQTKFVELGHPPVGCCSLTVPNLFGHSQAMSVILCNTKLDCDMAKERGIVAEILSFKHFEEELNSLLARSSLVSRQCLRETDVDGQR